MGKSPSTDAVKAPEPTPVPPKVEPAPAKPADAAPKPGPDYQAALMAERDKLKRLRAEHDRAVLELAEAKGALEQTEKLNRRDTAPPEAPSGFTEDDLADPNALTRRVGSILDAQEARLTEKFQQQLSEQNQQSAAGIKAQQQADAIERKIRTYKLADDPELGKTLRAEFDYALNVELALGDAPTMEEVELLLAEKVKKLERFQVKPEEAKPPANEPPQPAPASGGGETNHLAVGEKPKTREEGLAASLDKFEADHQQKQAQGG